jgi:hypothetical protein
MKMGRNSVFRRAVITSFWPPNGHRAHINPSCRRLIGYPKHNNTFWTNSRKPTEYQPTALTQTPSSASKTTNKFSAMPISSQSLHRVLYAKQKLMALCEDKHFFNDPTDLVLSALRNVKYTNPALTLDDVNKIIYYPAPSGGKTVALVSGGGAGHEPSFTRYICSPSASVFGG